MTRRLTAAVAVAICLAVAPSLAADGQPEKAPDFYIGPVLKFDLENDNSELTLSFTGAGKGVVAPELGLYDNRLLVGVRYMFLGTRADLTRAVYGGPTLFWYDEHIGGGVIVGRHLSRRVIVEASFRATGDWDGEADLSLGYGFDWPW
ncbi:MAG: hypothetical protein ACOX9R_16835 [Armatimonadota bacterium]|jgi:hypothetical protein